MAPPAPRRPAPSGGLAVLVVVTILAALAGPHATALNSLLAGRPGGIAWPAAPHAPAIRTPTPGAARAVAFTLAQRGKPYRWGAEGPGAFDCSGLTWAAWRAAGVAIPSRGPSRRHVAMVVGRGRMVEAPGRGIPVRSTSLRPGYLGAVRPGAGR
jgi:cell wall-associated NlpC family hydrolase